MDQRLEAARAAIAGLTRRAFAGAALALGACSTRPPEPVRTLAPGTLRIGTYFVNPPFEYASNGQRIGFEVDLMNEIARRLALTPVFVDTEWETILQQMQAGQYDAIVGGITITPERRRMLAWSTPYMTTTLSLVIDSRRSPPARRHERRRQLQPTGSKVGCAVMGVELDSPHPEERPAGPRLEGWPQSCCGHASRHRAPRGSSA